jgi:ABC-type multidrug transport system ATPase subunit
MGVMLEVQNLNKKFGDITAVDDLSFTVDEGDVYGFLGQNGAGKSTTIRMLLTLIKPDSGSIKVFGKNISEQRNEVLRQTGAVVERPDLYKYLSAYDNLSIFARMSGIKSSRTLIMDQLDMVGLADRSAGKVKTFSQGMKQRLGIAVALVHNPKLIILDEPTNGLDPQGIADMRTLILRLSNEMGKTVIVSSHLLNEIEQIASRMIIINKGRKIAEGIVADMLDPSHTVVHIDTTDNGRALEYLRQNFPGSHAAITNYAIILEMNKAGIPGLISTLSSMGIGILSVQPRHSLEDYFLSLTNAENYVEPAAN